MLQRTPMLMLLIACELAVGLPSTHKRGMVVVDTGGEVVPITSKVLQPFLSLGINPETSLALQQPVGPILKSHSLRSSM